ETQLLVLECLSTCGLCKMHILVEALKSKFPSVTAMIDRLVKMGFVRREHGKEDRRTVLVDLSVKGRKVLNQVHGERRKVFMQVFSRVSQAEREEYLRIIEKLVDSFSHPIEPTKKDKCL
ncbi:MAG: MarR family transcriptional regulator, partial [Candidatus Omnitrophica bacterium]|nr:MarR family transcriptional regulator [Candidatus Omnitrophota bacterium]